MTGRTVGAIQVVLIAVAVVMIVVALSVDEGFWWAMVGAFAGCAAAIIGTLGAGDR